MIRTTAETTESAGVDAVGQLRDRSDLVADAARLIDQATYHGQPTYNYVSRGDDPAFHEEADGRRAHAGVLLAMDQAESLAALAETAMLAAARDELAAEMITGAIQTAGQNAVSALDQIGLHLQKLTDAVDAHRVALVDTAGDLRAEVECLAEDVRGIDTTLERGIEDVPEAADALPADSRWTGLTAQIGAFSLATAATAVCLEFARMPDRLRWLPPVLAGYAVLQLVVVAALILAGAFAARRAEAVGPFEDDEDGNARYRRHDAEYVVGEDGIGPFVDLIVEAYEPLGQLYPGYVEPDFRDDEVRAEWIARVIAGDAEATFDVEVAFVAAGYPLDLAERRAELAGEDANRLPDWMSDWLPQSTHAENRP